MPRDEDTVLALRHGVLLGQFDGRIQVRANDMWTVARDVTNTSGPGGRDHSAVPALCVPRDRLECRSRLDQGALVRLQRPCVAFEGPLRIRDGAARKGPMRTSSCWGQPEFKILRLATLGDYGVEVDFVQTWMISRPFCARTSE
jgi:hypothetical protein